MITTGPGPREDYYIVEIRIFAPDARGEDYPVELKVLKWRDFPRLGWRCDHH